MVAEPSDNFRTVLTVVVVVLYVGISWANAEASNHRPSSKKQNNSPLRIDLIRRDSPHSPLTNDGVKFSHSEILRRAIHRSHNRLNKLQRYQSFITRSIRHGHSKSYYSPVNYQEGEFVMQAAIGSPNPQNLNFIVDTGSDLIWTQCLCEACIKQNYPVYNPSRSSQYKNISCHNNFCTVLYGECDIKQNCYYTYRYGDESSTQGTLSSDTFTFPIAGSRKSVQFPNTAFGCGRVQYGNFNKATGIVGLGRGQLSLVNQIKSHIDSTFSYCLGSIYNLTLVSPLYLGKVALDSSSSSHSFSTPLIPNSFFPSFYYLNITGISVSGKAVAIPEGTFDIQSDGNGGFYIDSGTTITYLPDQAFQPLLHALRSNIRGEPVNDTADIGLDFCYKATPALRLPDITFHFAGNVAYTLPLHNAFLFVYQARVELACLAIAPTGPLSSSGTLGSIQQQNFHITYDLANNRLSFSPTDCASI